MRFLVTRRQPGGDTGRERAESGGVPWGEHREPRGGGGGVEGAVRGPQERVKSAQEAPEGFVERHPGLHNFRKIHGKKYRK